MERKALNEPKSLGQELFTMTETSKTKRNIVRETITIQSGKSKLKTSTEDRQKNNMVVVEKSPSKLPLLKRDSTYIVNLKNSAKILNKTDAEAKFDHNVRPDSENKEPNRKILTSKNPVLNWNSNATKTDKANTRFQPDLVNDLEISAPAVSELSKETTQKNQLINKQMKKLEKGNNRDHYTRSDDTSSKDFHSKDLMKGSGETSIPRTNLSLLRQQKRSEINKIDTSFKNNKSLQETVCNNKSIETIIENSRKSGQLNLSDKNLNEVPIQVWNINSEIPQDTKKIDLTMDGENSNECRWWQQTELQKLIVASNKIKSIPRDIKNLQSLVSLDFHDNQLEIIDDAIGELGLLTNLNLSFNKLTTIPNNIKSLSRLKTLNISNNRLNMLPKDFGHLDDLQNLDLSKNCLSNLPKSFGWLVKLIKLNISCNSIKTLIPECFFSTKLSFIDASENQITEIPDQIGELAELEQLFLRQNKIKNIVVLKKCCRLKDWDLSFNQINEVPENTFDNLISLVNLNLRDNQINSLPESIRVLQTLERLDISNNNLSSLPCELAMIESLKQILLAGNPLRAIRKDIVNRGTVAILKHLKNQIAENLAEEAQIDEKDILRSNIVKSTKVFDLSGKKLNEVTESMISCCVQTTALVLNLKKNLLHDLPNELNNLSGQLNEINLSLNKFTNVPKSVFMLKNLVTLDIAGNQLTQVPEEIRNLKSLRELILADNRLIEISIGIYDLPILENLFLNNNCITTIDPLKIIKMNCLTTLNLQNNNIQNVPIELGKATQLKSMPLDGNPFRLPGHRILAKGTPAVLEYLRGRIVES